MSKLASLDDLFVHGLQEAYEAESQIKNALPRMTRAATSPDLKQALTTHGHETEEHGYRLTQILGMLGAPAYGKTCDGMTALIDEGERLIQSIQEPEVLDAALISAAQKLEHYEMAMYGCLCTYAEMLGYDQARRLLGQTLDEEENIDMRLTELAESVINPHAVEGDSA